MLNPASLNTAGIVVKRRDSRTRTPVQILLPLKQATSCSEPLYSHMWGVIIIMLLQGWSKWKYVNHLDYWMACTMSDVIIIIIIDIPILWKDGSGCGELSSLEDTWCMILQESPLMEWHESRTHLSGRMTWAGCMEKPMERP